MILRLYDRLKPKPKSLAWEDYFHGHETLLWEAAPASRMIFTPGMLFMSVFGVPFLGAGLYTFGSAFAQFSGGLQLSNILLFIFLLAFSVPFICVGFGLVFGIWLAAKYRPHFVRYGLSNKRAYVATSWWNHTMESYPILAQSYIALEQGRLDTVWFLRRQNVDDDGDRQTEKIGFEGLEDGTEVCKLLRQIQEQAK